ncbi:MAG TPA: hypothetical protein VG433_00655, partial [Pirellulales bacterium]|nr:hypothetical protein [Pirellulales bacterium]
MRDATGAAHLANVERRSLFSRFNDLKVRHRTGLYAVSEQAIAGSGGCLQDCLLLRVFFQISEVAADDILVLAGDALFADFIGGILVHRGEHIMQLHFRVAANGPGLDEIAGQNLALFVFQLRIGFVLGLERSFNRGRAIVALRNAAAIALGRPLVVAFAPLRLAIGVGLLLLPVAISTVGVLAILARLVCVLALAILLLLVGNLLVVSRDRLHLLQLLLHLLAGIGHLLLLVALLPRLIALLLAGLAALLTRLIALLARICLLRIGVCALALATGLGLTGR